MEGKPPASCAVNDIEFLYDTNGTYLIEGTSKN